MSGERYNNATKGPFTAGPLSNPFGWGCSCPPRLRQFIEANIDSTEICSIWSQLQEFCVPDHQVLWTGMSREAAQKWADCHGMQTLTTAMGDFMNPKSNLCPQKQKAHAAWISYIHGASALFALRICQGKVVTVLSNPPPQRFHPEGNTSFQCIEWPIVTGVLGNRTVSRIEIVHPMVTDFPYQIWPEDHENTWLDRYDASSVKVHWRQVKRRESLHQLPPTSESKSDFYEILKPSHSLAPLKLGSSRVAQKQPTPVHDCCAKDTSKARKAKQKQEWAKLEAALCAKMKEFSRVRKAERVSLHRQQASAMSDLRGKTKAAKKAKKAARQEHDRMRRELRNTHLQQLERIEQDSKAARQVLKARHKEELVHINGQSRCQHEKSRKIDAVVAELPQTSLCVCALLFVYLIFRLFFDATRKLWAACWGRSTVNSGAQS